MYEFLVMLFGLTNTLAIFCNLMNDVLYEFLDDFMVKCLDDIVVFGTSMEDHIMHSSKVLSRLGEYKSYVKKEKYELTSTKIIFLGHLVSMGQVKRTYKKLRTYWKPRLQCLN